MRHPSWGLERFIYSALGSAGEHTKIMTAERYIPGMMWHEEKRRSHKLLVGFVRNMEFLVIPAYLNFFKSMMRLENIGRNDWICPVATKCSIDSCASKSKISLLNLAAIRQILFNGGQNFLRYLILLLITQNSLAIIEILFTGNLFSNFCSGKIFISA